jgi:galactonate dehydratase
MFLLVKLHWAERNSYYVRPRWLFVRIETEGGVVGWGEGTLEGHTEAVQGSLKDIARR